MSEWYSGGAEADGDEMLACVGRLRDYAAEFGCSFHPSSRIVSRPRVSLDTSLEGMMVLQGGSHEQTQAREEGPGRRGGGSGR